MNRVANRDPGSSPHRRRGGACGAWNCAAPPASGPSPWASLAVPPDSWYGVLLKGVFNFSPQTTVLQAVVWVLYVGVVLTLFLRPQRAKAPVPAAPTP